ncbi:hypothetical protein ACFQYP_52585 [Nonomuraea antimicrobica]
MSVPRPQASASGERVSGEQSVAPAVGASVPAATASSSAASSSAAPSTAVPSPAAPSGDDWPEPARPGAPVVSAPAASSGGASAPAPQAAAAPSGGSAPVAGGAGAIQGQWAGVLAALKQRSIVVWANVSTNAQVVGVEGNLVTLGFTQVGAMKNFTGGGKDAVVASALGDVLGGTWRVEAVVGGSAPPPASRGSARPPLMARRPVAMGR